jgi:hypothetical protein
MIERHNGARSRAVTSGRPTLHDTARRPRFAFHSSGKAKQHAPVSRAGVFDGQESGHLPRMWERHPRRPTGQWPQHGRLRALEDFWSRTFLPYGAQGRRLQAGLRRASTADRQLPSMKGPGEYFLMIATGPWEVAVKDISTQRGQAASISNRGISPNWFVRHCLAGPGGLCQTIRRKQRQIAFASCVSQADVGRHHLACGVDIWGAVLTTSRSRTRRLHGAWLIGQYNA